MYKIVIFAMKIDQIERREKSFNHNLQSGTMMVLFYELGHINEMALECQNGLNEKKIANSNEENCFAISTGCSSELFSRLKLFTTKIYLPHNQ